VFITPTREEINQKYQKIHDDLTREYYKTHAISEADFQLQHAQLWKDHETELIQNGYRKKIYTHQFTKTFLGAGIVIATITVEIVLDQSKINNIKTTQKFDTYDGVTEASVDVK